MKKFSVLSFFIFVVAICSCISCGYLISTAIVTSSLFQYTSVVSSDSQNLYAISMASSTSENDLTSQKENLQSQNGAGYIYEKDENFHLIASIYENYNDAELVKNNLKTNGIEAEILTITLDTIQIEGNFTADEKNHAFKRHKIISRNLQKSL